MTVPGDRGLHDQAISEIGRLRRALDEASSALIQLSKLLPATSAHRKLARTASERAQRTLDA
jgi:hypothetical protein